MFASLIKGALVWFTLSSLFVESAYRSDASVKKIIDETRDIVDKGFPPKAAKGAFTLYLLLVVLFWPLGVFFKK